MESAMPNKYDEIMEKFGYFPVNNHIPITEPMVRALEEELGFDLPKDYRTFLLEYGLTALKGYITYPDPDRPGKPGGGVEAFLGINPGNSGDLMLTREGLGKRLPIEILPMADSPEGKICISLHGKDKGRIFSWMRDEPHNNPYRNLFFVAEDFDSFMNSLYLDDDQ